MVAWFHTEPSLLTDPTWVPTGDTTTVSIVPCAYKGFKYVTGHGFIVHKKNHFQVTVNVHANGPLTSVSPPEDFVGVVGAVKVESLFLVL